MRKLVATFLPLLIAVLIYAYFCERLNFIQDDAYISFRYVANFLAGDGLVYNVGERIEGYTNFGWVLYLILWGTLGAGYIVVSQITGFLFGAGVIVLTGLTARLVFRDDGQLPVWLSVFLVAFNQSLAYWSPAGLETAAFSFFALLSVYLYLTGRWFLIVSLVMAVLLRPEGALVAGLLIVIETIQKRSWPEFSLTCSVVALLVMLPMAAFKLFYYGSILPNPFYAKTAMSLDKLIMGLEYVGRFFTHYGFFGLGLVIPLIFYRKISDAVRAIWLFAVLYTLYIVLVGGDVLKVHRFFMPLFGLSAILITESLSLLTRRLAVKTRYLVFFLVGVPLIMATHFMPRQTVQTFYIAEKALTRKMKDTARKMAEIDSRNFSVAVATIGIFGYELMGHTIIDMLGLTDSTIARHSEPPIAGMSSTWKESKHNSKYLLGLKPDYILFSTGIKPSAPAEKALLVYPQFLEAYRTVGWNYRPDPNSTRELVQPVFKRFFDYDTDSIVPTYPVEFVENYKIGVDYNVAGDQQRAIEYYERAIEVSPEPVYIYLLFQRGFSHVFLNQHARAQMLLDSVLARDSLVFMAHEQLYKYAVLMGDSAKASIHRRWLKQLVPWHLPTIDNQIRLHLERNRARLKR